MSAPRPPIIERIQQVCRTPILYGRDVEAVEVYEWERDGVQTNAWPGDGQTPPYDAAKLLLKLYNFPTGQLRLLYFAEGTRTPPHLNKGDDVILYSLSAHQVEFVDRRVVFTRPGDCTLHPQGVMHHSETTGEGWRAEFAFDAQHRSGRDLIAVDGRDLALHPMTEWVEGGRRRTAFGEGDGAQGRFHAKLFCFPAYSLVEAHYPAGAEIAAHETTAETLLYVVSGRLAVTADGVSGEIGPGDMVRLSVGGSFGRRVLEDAVVLEVDGSEAPKPF